MPNSQGSEPAVEEQLETTRVILKEMTEHYDKGTYADYDARSAVLLNAEERAQKAEIILGKIYAWTQEKDGDLQRALDPDSFFGEGMTTARKHVRRLLQKCDVPGS